MLTVILSVITMIGLFLISSRKDIKEQVADHKDEAAYESQYRISFLTYIIHFYFLCKLKSSYSLSHNLIASHTGMNDLPCSARYASNFESRYFISATAFLQ